MLTDTRKQGGKRKSGGIKKKTSRNSTLSKKTLKMTPEGETPS